MVKLFNIVVSFDQEYDHLVCSTKCQCDAIRTRVLRTTYQLTNLIHFARKPQGPVSWNQGLARTCTNKVVKGSPKWQQLHNVNFVPLVNLTGIPFHSHSLKASQVILHLGHIFDRPSCMCFQSW